MAEITDLLFLARGQISLATPLGRWALYISQKGDQYFSAQSYGSSYLHVQLSPSSSWTVNHNLGAAFLPCAIYDVVGNLIEAEVAVVNDNQVQIKFVTPVAGYARVG